MPLVFLGKDTIDGGSPTLFDHGDTWVIQGYIPMDLTVTAGDECAGHETLVEIPKALMDFLPDGVRMRVDSPHVCEAGDMYMIKGLRVTDRAVLAKLRIPAYETVIEVRKVDLSEVVDGLERRGAHV